MKYKKCKHCNTLVNEDDSFCPNCGGNEFEIVEIVEDSKKEDNIQPKSSTNSEEQYTPIIPKMTSLTPEPNNDDEESIRKKRKKRNIAVIVVIIILALLSVAIGGGVAIYEGVVKPKAQTTVEVTTTTKENKTTKHQDKKSTTRNSNTTRYANTTRAASTTRRSSTTTNRNSSSYSSSGYTIGSVSNNVYRNSWAGIKFEFNDGWTMTEGPSYSSDKGVDDCFAAKCGDKNLSLGIMNVSEMEGKLTEEQICSLCFASADDTFDYDTKKTGTNTIAGKTYQSAEYISNSKGTKMDLFIRYKDGHVLMFLCLTKTSDPVSSVLNHIKSY